MGYSNTLHLHGEVLFSETEVNNRIDELAIQFLDSHGDKDPLLLGLLTGATIFTQRMVSRMTEIVPELNIDFDYMRVGNYGSSQQSSGPRIQGDLSGKTKVNGREVWIVDDMSDSGETLEHSVHHVQSLGAAAVKVMVLLERKIVKPKIVIPNIIGFETDTKKWLVGMGLDDPQIGNGGGRTLPFIAVALHQPEEN